MVDGRCEMPWSGAHFFDVNIFRGRWGNVVTTQRKAFDGMLWKLEWERQRRKLEPPQMTANPGYLRGWFLSFLEFRILRLGM